MTYKPVIFSFYGFDTTGNKILAKEAGRSEE